MLLFASVAIFSRQIGYLGKTMGEGGTNFRQTSLLLFAEAGMQPMPSFLLGRCYGQLGVTAEM